MFSAAISTLHSLQNVIQQMSENEYTTTLAIMDNATIGKHTRHVVELFQCLLNGYQQGTVNYDKRERNLVLENDICETIKAIDDIIGQLSVSDKVLNLTVENDEDTDEINTTYFRELLYNIEHCIHHQALIKVACNYLSIAITDENFGVAPSTIKYRLQQCAH